MSTKTAAPRYAALREPRGDRSSADDRRQAEERQREDGAEEERGDGGEGRGDPRSRDAGAHEHPVLECASSRNPAGDDAAEGVPGQLRRCHRKPALGLQGDPLQLPDGYEGERLDAEGDRDPLGFSLVSDRHWLNTSPTLGQRR